MADRLSVFAARLARFDPAAVIRLKDGAAWGRLPWDVVVRVPLEVGGDVVISATTLEKRPDADWRMSLPPAGIKVVETIPAEVIKDAAEKAAQALRQFKNRSVGERRVRDALLDHVVISGRSDRDGTEFAVSQRLVQAVVRLGLVDADNVDVLVAGPWTGLGTSRGSAWHRSASPLALRPLR